MCVHQLRLGAVGPHNCSSVLGDITASNQERARQDLDTRQVPQLPEVSGLGNLTRQDLDRFPSLEKGVGETD